MSVGAVTARSHPRSLSVANLRRPPTGAKVHAMRVTPRVLSRAPQSMAQRTVNTATSRAAIGRAAKLLARGSLPVLAAAVIGSLLYKKYIDPVGFPGFDGINPGGRHAEIPHGFSPGDYVPNPFDIGDFGPPENPALVDRDDLAPFPGGPRYWGDFATNPYDYPVPGINWPQVLATMPAGLPASHPLGSPGIKYKRLPNLAEAYQPDPYWTPRAGFEFELNLEPVPGRDFFRVRNDPPRKRDGNPKIKPANQFIWAVLKKIANAGGEFKEYIDIFAEATGYQPGSIFLPKRLRGTDTGRLTGRGDQLQTQAKTWWLFVGGGLNHLDWSLLATLLIENEIEDFVYGQLGKLSKSAAQSLDLTVGPQTGLAM